MGWSRRLDKHTEERIKKVWSNDPNLTTNQICERFGVSHTLAQRIRKDLELSPVKNDGLPTCTEMAKAKILYKVESRPTYKKPRNKKDHEQAENAAKKRRKKLNSTSC